MDFLDVCRHLNLRPPGVAFVACLELERRGLRFAVDFGTENAIEKLVDLERLDRINGRRLTSRKSDPRFTLTVKDRTFLKSCGVATP